MARRRLATRAFAEDDLMTGLASEAFFAAGFLAARFLAGILAGSDFLRAFLDAASFPDSFRPRVAALADLGFVVDFRATARTKRSLLMVRQSSIPSLAANFASSLTVRDRSASAVFKAQPPPNRCPSARRTRVHHTEG
jgi:hypothetical protein